MTFIFILINEPRQTARPTATHLSLLTVCHSDTWWTVVLKKAAVVAKTSIKTIKKLYFEG